jgi:hypothetical protein
MTSPSIIVAQRTESGGAPNKVDRIRNRQPSDGGRDATLFEPAKDDEVLTALVAALTRAFDDGSPVSGQSLERRREIAVAALRRIRSFRRRSVPIDDRPSCVRDLAKGLIDYLEARSDLVGPLMKDYQFVASRLLDAYQKAGGS